MAYYTLAGVSYAPAPHPVHGIVFQKAARKSTLNTGDTKTVNGVTYTFNENRRWARADKKSRSRRSSPGANKMPPNVAIPVLEDAPKVKGKSRRMTPPAAPKANTEEIARQARRSAPRAMSAEGLKPKGKPAQVKPKAKAEAKPKASFGDKTKAVLEAANATQTGRLGDSKVFISHVWDTVQKQHPGMFKSREDFNKHLLEANRKRDMDLSRADMAYALNQDDVKGSELTHQNSSYHFIRLDGNTPPAKAEAKPKAAPKKEAATGKFEQIKNAKRFEEVLLQNYDKLSQDYNLGNFVPIARLRKEIGDGASDKQFDEWLVGMQRKGLIQLQGDEGDVRSPRDAVDIGGGILRTHVAIEPDGERATRGKSQQRPGAPKPANAINSATGFRDEINKLYDKLDDGNIEGVRIDRLRKELGDRVSRRQFNQWLLKMQADGVIQLAGEVTPNITKSQIEDAVQTPGGGLTSGLRFYIKRL